MAARTCPRCGSPVREGARFCGNCGTAVTAAQPFVGPAETEMMLGPHPGAAGTIAAATNQPMQYAGFWIRFLAAFIDSIVVSIVTNPITLLIGQGFNPEVREDAFGTTTIDWNFDGTRLGLALLISTIIPFVYYVVALSRWGQTLGALAVSIKVVRTDGALLSPGAAFVRTIGAWVSGVALGLGYLWMIWDRRKQTWHDKMAGSVVIKGKRSGDA